MQVPGSWSGSTKDVPDDAELTMAWYAKGEGDADWTELTDGIDTTDGSLTISDALVGKRIKLRRALSITRLSGFLPIALPRRGSITCCA